MFENLTHTEIESDVYQGYTVFVEYSHGDADMFETSEYKTSTLSGLKSFIIEFEKVVECVDTARSNGTSYRSIKCDLVDVWKDIIFDGSGVPAAMRIEKIELFDSGKKYLVTGWE